MNNSVKSVTFFVLGSIIWLILYVSVIKPKNTPIVEETNTNQLLVENQKLKSENDSLRAELQSQAQRTDFKEKKYTLTSNYHRSKVVTKWVNLRIQHNKS